MHPPDLSAGNAALHPEYAKQRAHGRVDCPGFCAGGTPQLRVVNPLHRLLVLYKDLRRTGLHFLPLVSRQMETGRLVDRLDADVCFPATAGGERTSIALPVPKLAAFAVERSLSLHRPVGHGTVGNLVPFGGCEKYC